MYQLAVVWRRWQQRWQRLRHATARNWSAPPSEQEHGLPSGWVVALSVALVAVLALSVAGWAIAHQKGYRHFDVLTPSMGEAAPVGTLIITEPVRIHDVQLGDLITFTPRDGTHSYTHRVVQVGPGGVKTKGDLNGAVDAWLVTDELLVGRVIHRLWGMGWLLRCLPWLILGWYVMWVLTRLLVPRKHRTGARLVGASVVFSAVSLWIQPLVRATILGQRPVGENGVDASIVGVGAMPITVHAEEGDAFAHLRPGQWGTVYSPTPDEYGMHWYFPQLHLTGWWLVGVVAFVLSPILYSLVVGWRRELARHRAQEQRCAAVTPSGVEPQRARAVGGAHRFEFTEITAGDAPAGMPRVVPVYSVATRVIRVTSPRRCAVHGPVGGVAEQQAPSHQSAD